MHTTLPVARQHLVDGIINFLSGSETNTPTTFSYDLTISTVLSVDPPSITITSTFLYDCLSIELKVLAIVRELLKQTVTMVIFIYTAILMN